MIKPDTGKGSAEEAPQTAPESPPGPRPKDGTGQSPCIYFARGDCTFGDTCKDLHGKPSTKPKGKGDKKGKGQGKTMPPAAEAADTAAVASTFFEGRRGTHTVPGVTARAAARLGDYYDAGPKEH